VFGVKRAVPSRRRLPPKPRIALDLQGLGGRPDLFRVSVGARRDPAVERWLTEGSVELKAIAQRWFALMRDCGDDVLELVHDGCPVACVEDAPFGYVNAFKSHVNVGFFNGASLEDPAGVLEGSGKRMRHVKLVLGRPSNDAVLRALVDAAYVDVKARLAAARAASEE